MNLKAVSPVKELPDDLREPLHSLQADLDWLLARITTEPDFVPLARDSIGNRLSQIETAAYRLVNS